MPPPILTTAEFDREEGLFEELRLHDAHDEVHRLREEQETLKKLKGKKKKKTPSRLLRDEQRAEQRRAGAEKLVARLEAERVERAGEEEDDDEKTESLAKSGAGRPQRLGA